ncbi:MAG: hypothetical protein ACF8R7_02130 [Phycisphaerales bacterium JB039]
MTVPSGSDRQTLEPDGPIQIGSLIHELGEDGQTLATAECVALDHHRAFTVEWDDMYEAVPMHWRLTTSFRELENGTQVQCLGRCRAPRLLGWIIVWLMMSSYKRVCETRLRQAKAELEGQTN